MVKHTILLKFEESQQNIVIKSSADLKDNALVHLCDEDACGCIPHFEARCLNLNKLVHLDLSNSQLRSLPEPLCNLPLISLNLSRNYLNEVPQCLLSGLDSLEALDLSHNKILEFEVKPKCARSLQTLDLGSNKMQYLPIWIVHARCTNLSELCYKNNALGSTEEGLYRKICAYSLRKIVLQNSLVLNYNLSFIKSIYTLKDIDISNGYFENNKNSFTNYEDLLDNPAWKHGVESLNLSGLNMGLLPEYIGGLKAIKELYLSRNDLIWLPESVGLLPNLEVLDISENHLCVLPKALGCLRNLRILKMQINMLPDVGILATLTNLHTLDLYRNELDFFELDISQYKYLDLEENLFNAATLTKSEEYAAKRDSYRQDFNLSRVIGSRREILKTPEESSEEYVENYSEDDASSDSSIPVNNYLEECWDEKTMRESHPDVTPSDEEWRGYLPPVRPKKKLRRRLSLEHLLDDLYVDAD